MSGDVITLELVRHRATPGPNGAYLVSVDGVARGATWVPKRAVSNVTFVRAELAGERHAYTLTKSDAGLYGLSVGARDVATADLFSDKAKEA